MTDLATAAVVARCEPFSGRYRGDIAVRLAFHFTSACPPDIDKLCRAVLDALTGVMYADDRQVVALSARKVCSASKEATYVTVSTL